MLAAFILLASAPTFPERMPGMIEACLQAAAENEGHVTRSEKSHEYICSGPPARQLWTFSEQAGVESWEQDVPSEGRWVSREFPLGGCFKRVRDAEGRETDTGLSCTIWIPRPASRAG